MNSATRAHAWLAQRKLEKLSGQYPLEMNTSSLTDLLYHLLDDISVKKHSVKKGFAWQPLQETEVVYRFALLPTGPDTLTPCLWQCTAEDIDSLPDVKGYALQPGSPKKHLSLRLYAEYRKMLYSTGYRSFLPTQTS